MVKLINNLKKTAKVKINKLRNGTFFEFNDKFYQLLSFNKESKLYDCVCIPTMEHAHFFIGTVVNPVDVTITINGYTAEE